ncbi:tetratricopeptide repeat protein [Sorangium sp. So ce145]|uniref:tetratricopeptide repeat protein n=1 Tax=Sorangium sp. So ce145 TaxID=3133285 RepID=UPI003F645B9F
MTPWLRRSTSLLAISGLLSLSMPAAAQDIATAAALFEQGLADMQAGRYETGCKALAESERIDPQPGTLFTLASCEAQWGRTATAVARFKDYLARFDRLTPAEQARQRERPSLSKQEIERLAPRVPKLALSLPPGAPAGTVVTRDGISQGEAMLGLALPVDPGEHRISIQTPGGPLREQRITIAEGETKQLTLALTEAPAPAPPAPPLPSPQPAGPEPAGPDAPAGSGGRRTAMVVAGGLGAAGLVLGGITGALVLDKKGTIDEHCGSGIHAADPKACDTTGRDAGTSANSLATVSTIGFAVGLAGAGTALILYLTEPKAAAPSVSPSQRWITAGVLEAGPEGALFGARGRF